MIGSTHRATTQGCHRCCIDNRPTFLAHHLLDRIPGDEVNSLHIYAHRPVPIFFADVEDSPTAPDTSIVEEHIQSTIGVHGLFHYGLRLRAESDIAPHGHRLTPRLLDELHSFLRGVGIDILYYHPGTFLRKQ